MIIHQIENLGYYNSFSNCKISKKIIFFEVVKFQKFDDFQNCKILKFLEFSELKGLEIPKLEICGIFLIANFWTLLFKLKD